MREERRHIQSARLAAFALAISALLAAPDAAGQQRSRRQIVKRTMPAVVMVIAADVADGEVRLAGSGSGTIITRDGAILTNFHVINDIQAARLHDLFFIARFRSADQDPEPVCAGVPSTAKVKPNQDLALIKCTLDLNGRRFRARNWPTIPIGRSEDLIPGEEVVVIGYPAVGGSTIHVTAGQISGWSGEHGGAGRAFIKTEAAISLGNSGGTAINEDGELIGIPTAFRVTTHETGGAIATVGKVGLVRPIEHARDMIEIAHAGWTPREGDNAVTKTANTAPRQPTSDAKPHTAHRTKPEQVRGVVVQARVTDVANGRPVGGASVIVFKAGIGKRDLDPDKLSEQALTHTRTNRNGEIKTVPIPRGASYTVAILAVGYYPLIEENVLVINDDTPTPYAPWERITIERR